MAKIRPLDWATLPPVLTIDDAAIIMKISRQSVWRYVKDGKIPAARVGKLWRISRDKLKEFLSGGTG